MHITAEQAPGAIRVDENCFHGWFLFLDVALDPVNCRFELLTTQCSPKSDFGVEQNLLRA